ncbi:MAG: GGDEF domain-containing protein [Deltaproteobacteria bacterium]|nr:GGDEF domain-containing protein [Candidatus Anaeroferrophillacea bacterium]
MQIKLGTRLILANTIIMFISLGVFAPLLTDTDFHRLLLFALLYVVANLVLIPAALHWICLADLRTIQNVIGGIKRGDYDIELEAAPEPHDPEDEYELNRLKREIVWIRRAIGMREEDIRHQTRQIQTLNEALRIEAITDKLTGLHNARFFWERIGDCFNDHLRTGEPFAFVILDIDFFKRVNDTYGHLNGDRVLEQFALTLRENTRKTDVAARIGGEEFALILRHISPRDTQNNLRRLHVRLREQDLHLGAETTIRITVSIGYYVISDRPPAPADETPRSPHDIVKRADDALYWVKDNGRDGLMAWHELDPGYREQRRNAPPTAGEPPAGTAPAAADIQPARPEA